MELAIASAVTNPMVIKARQSLRRLRPDVETPALVLLEPALLAAARRFRAALPGVRTFFAVKANPDPRIVAKLAAQGFSFDVASAGEVQLAAGLDVPGSRMILANPVKDGRTVAAMFAHEVGTYTFDSACELEKIAAFRRSSGSRHNPAALVRIKTSSASAQCDLSKKFGCDAREAVPLLRHALSLGLRAAGVAFHAGSNLRDPAHFETALVAALAVVREAAQHGLRLEILDIGGGVPVDPMGDPAVTRNALAAIGAALGRHDLSGLDVWAEPGRCIAAPAAVLCVSVIGRKRQGGADWLFLDDGVYGCYAQTVFEGARYLFLPVADSHWAPGAVGDFAPHVVAGPTCDSVDIIARDVWLPRNLAVGDRLFSVNMGAYTIASATTFNGFAPATTLDMPTQPAPGLP